ncbi:MAG: HD domain-containing protein [Acidobacteriota bacterium]|nr:HD domain-containing protein [Acidobacteriota bacterium]
MAARFTTLSKLGKVYVLGVSAIGLAIAAHSLGQLFVQQVDPQWLILAALTLLTGAFTVRIPGIPAHLSVSDTFVLVSVLLFGPAAGTIIALLDALIISLRVGRNTREPFRVIFNVSAVALSTNTAAQVFFGVAGIQPYSIEPTPLGRILFPLFLCALTYFLLNSWLVTFALALEKGRPPFAIWRDNFLWLSVNYFVGGSVAGLLVTYSREIDLTTLGIIVPLLLVSYLTFKTSLGRIEDANRHLTQVNAMYLSTIETLAMAIDAKDQITHGHIRRVQRYAVGLARAVGVNDDTQIKAIEAAALLHDMGKLAIPEFILNKPGRLTSNEFDVMKQHANIGADILSSIEFPYPVVPIVRHHHESWDGTGYPDALKGVEIPLGARVLSVVDCYDALTSDRPYRPRLSVDDAIQILVQRRGSMYDPLIVDKFIETQKQLSEEAQEGDREKDAIDSIATKLRITPETTAPPLGEVPEQLPLQILSLLRSIHPSPRGLSVEDFGVIVSRQVLRLTDARSVALYAVAENEHSIRCLYADGPLSQLVGGPEIALGERLSGWVAAHRTPIWNSDATLDLPSELARSAGVDLGSSVPLMDGDLLVGTLTFYASAGGEIAVEQRLLIQSIAPQLATALSASVAHDQVAAIDGSNRSSREALYAILDALLSHRARGVARSHPDSQSIVLLTLLPHGGSDGTWNTEQAHLLANISAATGRTGTVVRLSSDKLLVTASLRQLTSLGLDSGSTARAAQRSLGISVKEIGNSLELRRVLGLIQQGDQSSGKPLVH